MIYKNYYSNKNDVKKFTFFKFELIYIFNLIFLKTVKTFYFWKSNYNFYIYQFYLNL